MHTSRRKAVSLWTLFLCGILGGVMVFSLHMKQKAEYDLSAAERQREAHMMKPHAETDLERRVREEQELGHSLWPFVQLLKKDALYPPTKEEIEVRARKGLCAIDPYSKCLSDEEYKKEQAAQINRYEGIGIVIAPHHSGAEVTDVRLRSPAEKAGLRIGDIITHIVADGQTLALGGMSEKELLEHLRGAQGTAISLVFARNGKSRTLRSITRVEDAVPTVERVRMLAPHYGYLHISMFTENQTADELSYALELLERQRVLHGMIIDLRGDLGGSFHEVIRMAGFFLDGGVITTTYSRTKGKKSYDAPPGDRLAGVPIVILVDKNSASASEIFAGALSDREIPRAKLMGEKTFGKGVGQTTEVAPKGVTVRLTTFEFFTPRGNSIQGKGLTPDPVLLEMYHDTNDTDEWRGAALNYLLHEYREQRKQRR